MRVASKERSLASFDIATSTHIQLMSNPIKHHYLPEFYLQRWTGRDGRLTEFRRPHRDLVEKRKFPSATGFERELYSIKSRKDPATRQELETGFLGKVDHDAALALSFLDEKGTRPTEDKLRDGWSRFIMSLLHRSPDRVEWVRDQLRSREKDTLAEVERRYDDLRGPNDPATFEEYLRAAGTGVSEESVVILLAQMMDSEKIGNAINRMHWGVGRLDRHRFGLMTSDAPVMVSNGIGHKDGFVVLPTSPTSFFIAANRAQVLQAFATQTNRALELAFNDAIVRQARHLVIASSGEQRRFVDNRFLRTDDQRDSSGRITWKSPLIDIAP